MNIKIVASAFVIAMASCAGKSSNDPMNNIVSMDLKDSSVYSFSLKDVTGKETINLADYKGKKILLVNVASECGYTPQYKDLQTLFDANKDRLVIIGLPCNQFGGQEPGTGDEIASFCEKNYGVTFPITEKIDVKGENQHPLYQWLTLKQYNGLDDFNVKWNFNKFLISEDGKLLAYFSSSVKPLSSEITDYLK